MFTSSYMWITCRCKAWRRLRLQPEVTEQTQIVSTGNREMASSGEQQTVTPHQVQPKPFGYTHGAYLRMNCPNWTSQQTLYKSTERRVRAVSYVGYTHIWVFNWWCFAVAADGDTNVGTRGFAGESQGVRDAGSGSEGTEFKSSHMYLRSSVFESDYMLPNAVVRARPLSER